MSFLISEDEIKKNRALSNWGDLEKFDFYTDEDTVAISTPVRRALTAEKNGMHIVHVG
jgi:hypothetical protein